jgi:hypothetical protein
MRRRTTADQIQGTARIAVYGERAMQYARDHRPNGAEADRCRQSGGG